MKLYIVVDESLTPGQQLAQSSHAAFQISMMYPKHVKTWFHESNTLVVLSHKDPLAVAIEVGKKWTTVCEPDWEGRPVTAVAFLPDPEVGPLLSDLNLALKEVITV